MVQMFSIINILNCLPPLIFVLKHICTRLTILTSSKKQSQDKTLYWPVGSQHAPLGLQINYFIISKNADHIDYLYGEGERGSVKKEGVRIKWASNYLILIYIIYSG